MQKVTRFVFSSVVACLSLLYACRLHWHPPPHTRPEEYSFSTEKYISNRLFGDRSPINRRDPESKAQIRMYQCTGLVAHNNGVIEPVPLRQSHITVAFEKWRTNLPSSPLTALQLPRGTP